jgi:hypothetical protein
MGGIFSFTKHAERTSHQVFEGAENATSQTGEAIKSADERFDKGDNWFKKNHKYVVYGAPAVLVLLIFIHFLLSWACRELKYSLLQAWVITLLTGGLGLIYFLYKAKIVYDRKLVHRHEMMYMRHHHRHGRHHHHHDDYDDYGNSDRPFKRERPIHHGTNYESD